MDKILNFIDLLIPSELKNEEKVFSQSRIFIVLLSLSTIGIVLGHVLFVNGITNTPFNFYIGYLYSIGPILVLWLSKKLTLTINIALLLASINLNTAILESGGCSSPIIYWLSIIPIMVLVIIGFKSAIYWSGFLCINIFAIYLYTSDKNLNAFTKEEYFYNAMTLLIMVTVTVFLFWKLKDRLVKQLEAQRLVLQQKNDLLKKKTSELDIAHNKIKNTNQTLEIQNNRLSQTQKALVDSNKALERYAHTVAHDLKEPLRSINSFTQLLHRHYDRKELIDDTSKEFFEFVFGGTDNMNQLISEMLKFSSNNQESLKRIDLNQTVKIVRDNLSNQIKETGVEITSERLPKIYGLPIPLTQLFQNIVSNALKFKREGVAPQIYIKACEKETEWVLSIADNGIGIKQKDCLKIFQEFEQVQQAQKHQGHGIGLTTCKDIVEKHNGSIWLKSQLGEGTTFYFSLPKQPETSAKKDELKTNIQLKEPQSALNS